MYLAEIRGGLCKNNKIHILQKKFKHYLDYHLVGRAIVAPLLVNG